MKRTAVIVSMYAAIAVLVFPVFPHFVSPNEFSRWLLGASLIEHRTIEVSALAPMFGPRFEDLSERAGRLYSNKAPGASLVGLAGYAAVRPLSRAPTAANLRLTLTAMRLVASSLPLIALALLMARLAKRLGADADAHRFGTFVLLFATPLFSYGLLYFAHALTAAAVFLAWALLFARPDSPPLHEILAGALLGLAVVSEYPVAITLLVIAIILAWQHRFPALARVIAGGIPFALALAAYNTEAFGGPLQLSSGHERFAEFRTLAGTGIFGIGIPSPSAAAGMLFGARRGLFLLAPILLIGIFRMPALRRTLSKPAFVALIALPASILIIHAGYANWHGGWAVGPRYLATAMPFLAFPLFLRRPSFLEFAAAGFSVFAVAVAALTFPFPPNAFPLPWATFSLPLLRDGLVAPNLLHLAGRPAALIAPWILILIALIACARRQIAAVTAGVAVAALVALVGSARTPSLPERLQLAYVREVYFEQRGALDLGIPIPARLLARRDFELTLPPSPWRF